jgi:amino acid permease
MVDAGPMPQLVFVVILGCVIYVALSSTPELVTLFVRNVFKQWFQQVNNDQVGLCILRRHLINQTTAR